MPPSRSHLSASATEGKDLCSAPCDRGWTATERKDLCSAPCVRGGTTTEGKDLCSAPCVRGGRQTLAALYTFGGQIHAEPQKGRSIRHYRRADPCGTTEGQIHAALQTGRSIRHYRRADPFGTTDGQIHAALQTGRSMRRFIHLAGVASTIATRPAPMVSCLAWHCT